MKSKLIIDQKAGYAILMVGLEIVCAIKLTTLLDYGIAPIEKKKG